MPWVCPADEVKLELLQNPVKPVRVEEPKAFS